MDPALDLEARRLLVSAALTTLASRLVRGRVDPHSAPEDLLEIARRLDEEVGPVERSHGLRFMPPYPGVTRGVEEAGGGIRLVLASEVYREGPLGVAFTVLIPGRRPQVSVAPVGTIIPSEWRPFSDRFGHA